MPTRRTFLKTSSLGLGAGVGAVALSPIMQQLKAQAAGNSAAPPKRFVFVMRGNGLRPFGIVPKGLEQYGKDQFKADKLIDVSLKDKQLNESMKSLEPFKDQLSIIQGLSSKICKGPHGGHFGVLGAYTSGDHAPPRRETLDITLAKQFPGILE